MRVCYLVFYTSAKDIMHLCSLSLSAFR